MHRKRGGFVGHASTEGKQKRGTPFQALSKHFTCFTDAGRAVDRVCSGDILAVYLASRRSGHGGFRNHNSLC